MFYDRFRELCYKSGSNPTAVGEKLGIPRSTVSAWKVRGNAPSIATAQFLLGHRDIQTTMNIYTHVSREMLSSVREKLIEKTR